MKENIRSSMCSTSWSQSVQSHASDKNDTKLYDAASTSNSTSQYSTEFDAWYWNIACVHTVKRIGGLRYLFLPSPPKRNRGNTEKALQQHTQIPQIVSGYPCSDLNVRMQTESLNFHTDGRWECTAQLVIQETILVELSEANTTERMFQVSSLYQRGVAVRWKGMNYVWGGPYVGRAFIRNILSGYYVWAPFHTEGKPYVTPLIQSVWRQV